MKRFRTLLVFAVATLLASVAFASPHDSNPMLQAFNQGSASLQVAWFKAGLNGDYSGIPALRRKAIAAGTRQYKRWIAGKPADQKAAAKSLFIAWAQMLGTPMDDVSNNLDEADAQSAASARDAYNKALIAFKLETDDG